MEIEEFVTKIYSNKIIDINEYEKIHVLLKKIREKIKKSSNNTSYDKNVVNIVSKTVEFEIYNPYFVQYYNNLFYIVKDKNPVFGDKVGNHDFIEVVFDEMDSGDLVKVVDNLPKTLEFILGLIGTK